MKYVSIDIETGGLNPHYHSILEFGAILEDTNNPLPFEKIPKFATLLLRKDENYVGSAYALAMHKEIFEELSNPEKSSILTMDYMALPQAFHIWIKKVMPELWKHSNYNPSLPLKINVAGKNFGHFDEQFINNYLPHFKNYIEFNHRMLDPAMLYFDPETDNSLPNLSICKQRAGLKDESIAHRTLRDAMDVIEVIRYKLYPHKTQNQNVTTT